MGPLQRVVEEWSRSRDVEPSVLPPSHNAASLYRMSLRALSQVNRFNYVPQPFRTIHEFRTMAVPYRNRSEPLTEFTLYRDRSEAFTEFRTATVPYG